MTVLSNKMFSPEFKSKLKTSLVRIDISTYKSFTDVVTRKHMKAT